MKAALDLADRLDDDAILAMHAALLGAHAPGIVGRWRQEQVLIGGDSFGPHEADFVPPHHDHVPALMDDLVRFSRRPELPLLIQAAVAHARFETVHPFPEGNGRTGRALIHAMLRGHGLTRHVTVPVSAGLLTDTGGYFGTLTAYREAPQRRSSRALPKPPSLLRPMDACSSPSCAPSEQAGRAGSRLGVARLPAQPDVAVLRGAHRAR